MQLAKKFRNTFIGDRAFFSMLGAILIPIVIQNAFTQFVSLLDNLMVGRLGTESMSGVAIANQILFVFNLFVFGINACASVMGAQYAGKKDYEGVRKVLRYRLVLDFVFVTIWALVLGFFGEALIQRFLTEDGSGDLSLVLSEGLDYLRVMLLGLLPFAFSQAYASSLRENSETVFPMVTSIVAVVLNLFFNWVLIFGNLGAPELGVKGAAIATVISRFAEVLILVIGTHVGAHRASKGKTSKGIFKLFEAKVAYASGLFTHFKLSLKDFFLITRKGGMLILNETLWGLGNTILARQYSLRGLLAVSALNIGNTVNNLFMISVFSTGEAIAIVLGQRLGRGEVEEAKKCSKKLLFFTVTLCAGFGLAMAAAAPFVPLLYKTEPEVQALATKLLFVNAAYLPIEALINGCYFTLRSGGKILITMAFDSLFICLVLVPFLYALVHWTTLSFLALYLLVKLPDLIKITCGLLLVNRGKWARTLIAPSENET